MTTLRLGLAASLALVAAAGVASGPFAASRASAAAWEKYLLVVPLQPATPAARKVIWFGPAFRQAWGRASLSLNTVVFLKDDEWEALRREYKLGQGEPDPGVMERLADEKEIALLYGTFAVQGHSVTLTLHLIPARNEEARSFTASATDQHLRSLFAQALRQSLGILDIKVSESTWTELGSIPGTDRLAALENYSQAEAALVTGTDPAQVSAMAARALAADADCAGALAADAWCRLRALPAAGDPERARGLDQAQNRLDQAVHLEPHNPILNRIRLDLLLAGKKYTEAVSLGENVVGAHPMDYGSYLLLGKAYAAVSRQADAENLLLRGLEQQGTALQKKPFQWELGLLLLKSKDAQADIYLHEVERLEPGNFAVHFFRSSALFRLGKYLDAMSEVQQAEPLSNPPALKELKAKIALALGSDCLKDEDIDRAYTYTTIASKLRPRHFETNLLLAKVLRKKGYAGEARQQLDVARETLDPSRPMDHFLLGTEFIAQGLKEEGAGEYTQYLKLRPQAPERRQLIALIRKLRGAADEEE